MLRGEKNAIFFEKLCESWVLNFIFKNIEKPFKAA